MKTITFDLKLDVGIVVNLVTVAGIQPGGDLVAGGNQPIADGIDPSLNLVALVIGQKTDFVKHKKTSLLIWECRSMFTIA